MIIIISSAGVQEIELEIGTNNSVFVAYKDLGNSNKITVKKNSSGAWETLGTEGFSDFAINKVSLTLNNQNVPYVAYIQTDRKPIISKFDGSNWTSLGEIILENGATPINNVVVELRMVFGSNNSLFIIMNSGIIAKYLN